MNTQKNTLMVSIKCLVYNHEPYLRQCLEGFVMQKTNFRFEAIVHDDASTDGSAAIIREYAEKYPDIIKPIFETENLYCKFDGTLRRIMDEACKGKYIALCEGDDYWIDPLKLQKQVDLLENHKESGMCFTQYDTFPTRKVSKAIPRNFEHVTVEEIINRNFSIGTQTVLYKKSVYEKLPKYFLKENFRRGDYPLWIEFAFLSNVLFVNETTAIYRVTGESASHSTLIENEIKFLRKGFECSVFYIQKFNLEVSIDWKKFYLAAMKVCFNHNNKREALKIFKESFIKKSVSVKEQLFFIGLFCKPIRSFINSRYKN